MAPCFWLLWMLVVMLNNNLSRAEVDCIIDPGSVVTRPQTNPLLQCICSGLSNDTLSIVWCLNTTCAIQIQTDVNYEVIDVPYDVAAGTKNLTLTILEAQVNDTRTYYCAANNTIVAQVDVEILEIPTATILPDNATITNGQNTTLNCEITNSTDEVITPSVSVVWSKNGVNITDSDLNLDGEDDLQISNSQLVITDADSFDGGTYACGLYNFVLDVIDSVVMNTPVQMVTGETKMGVKEGATAIIECSAKGYPLPTMVWQYEATDGATVNVQMKELFSTTTSTLTLSNTKTSQAGYINCSASNGIGEGSYTMYKLVVESGCNHMVTSMCTFTNLIIVYAVTKYISQAF